MYKYKLPLAILLTANSNISNADITRYHYSPLETNIENIIINNADNPPPTNGRPYAIVNNIVPRGGKEMRLLQPSHWDASIWTGFSELGYSNFLQKALANVSQEAEFGSTAVQMSHTSMGLHLNTFNTDLPTIYTATSLQYFVGFPGGKKVWYPAEKLCVSGEAKIETSYSEGSVNQAMYTLHFSNDKNQAVFLNVMLFDSRENYSMKDIVHWDAQDTNTAIVISHAQKQFQKNPNVKYTSTIDEFGIPLLPATAGTAPKIMSGYAFCMTQAQFKLAIADVNSQHGLDYDVTPDKWKMNFALIGPEINTQTGDGHMGMTVKNFWVYNKEVN
ncbi:hypothetical protein [Motilimonas cestriensis]|uniref:hypothetical protein n=1 Tax=Motilimonas cestriensis TaxID=2742685 RepID=UPI003DA55F31